ncbi:MAG: 7TM domain-containing protein [bacterium]
MNRERFLVFWTLFVLILAGSACIIIRSIALSKSTLARGDSIWHVKYHVSLQPLHDDTLLKISLPSDTAHVRKLRQTFSHPGFSMYMIKTKETFNQHVMAVARNNENILQFDAHFHIHVSPHETHKPSSAKTLLTSETRYHYLRKEKEIQVKSQNIKELARNCSKGMEPKKRIVDNIYAYCSEQVAESDVTGPHDALGTLSARKGSSLGKVRLMVALCRAIRIPARLVTGFILEDTPNAAPHYWLEVYLNKRWIPYDPVNGYAEAIPAHYLPVRKDSIHFVKTEDKSEYHFNCQIMRENKARPLSLPRKLGWLAIFDITRLPLNMQEILALLLLLPAGALITSIIRNIIGIQTIGTFTPALLALSFVYTDWRFGVAIFVLVFIIGLASRCFLDQMKLLMIPRLSMILAIIVLCLTFSVSIVDYFELALDARSIILPIVILTMMIERFYIHSEEDSLLWALQLLAGTLLVSSICFIVLKWQYLGRLAVQFPEAQFLIAAALIVVGRYSGYRLSELWRFKNFMEFFSFTSSSRDDL